MMSRQQPKPQSPTNPAAKNHMNVKLCSATAKLAKTIIKSIEIKLNDANPTIKIL